jgi:hypothetical protein
MTLSALSDANAVCTAAQLGEVVGRTTRQIHALTVEKVLQKSKRGGGYPLAASVQAFLAHREAIVRRDCSRTKGDFETARARRMAALALIEEARARQLSGKLLDGERVDRAVMNVMMIVKNHVLSLPNRCTRLLAPYTGGGENAKIVRKIMTEAARSTLTEASRFDVRVSCRDRKSAQRERTSKNGDDADD